MGSAYLQSKGVKVIPTVRWGNLESFNYCFDGIEKGSIVAVSTIGLKSNKSNFMLGYNEMYSRIKPSTVICYGKPFEEMKGNIIEVDYADTNNLNKGFFVKKTMVAYVDSVEKGGGSASGHESGNPKPQWQPKKEEEKRFFGKPGEIKHTFIKTKKGGYWVHTKIGDNGKATKERQDTDHGNSKQHSNPHDNTIDWDEKTAKPIWGKQINYPDGNVPEFKIFFMEVAKMKDNQILNNATEEFNENYKSLDEFKDSVYRGSEIVFEWKGIEYEIFRYDKNKFWCGRQDNLVFDTYTFDELMKTEIDGEKLIDICTKITVIERTF